MLNSEDIIVSETGPVQSGMPCYETQSHIKWHVVLLETVPYKVACRVVRDSPVQSGVPCCPIDNTSSGLQ